MIKRVIVGALTTNCYLYYTKNCECLIIDPGWDEHKIWARIHKLKLRPLGIILTHGHPDHTGAAGRLKALLNRKGLEPAVAIHEADKVCLEKNTSSAGEDFFSSFRSHPEYNHAATDLVADCLIRENDYMFGTDLKAIETPGHTPGSLCFYSEREQVLFSGDTLFNGGIGKPWPPGFREEELIASIRHKILLLPEETTVLPGHGPETTIGWERANNPFLG